MSMQYETAEVIIISFYHSKKPTIVIICADKRTDWNHNEETDVIWNMTVQNNPKEFMGVSCNQWGSSSYDE